MLIPDYFKTTHILFSKNILLAYPNDRFLLLSSASEILVGIRAHYRLIHFKLSSVLMADKTFISKTVCNVIIEK
jgi:hypothetical protein